MRIYLMFDLKLGIQYWYEEEIIVCKLLVPIKVVPLKNGYFLHIKFELHRYQQMNESRTHFPANTKLNLIRTVSQFSPSNDQLPHFF